ncbi:tetratricopeptide repeat protein [Spirosoma sp. KCTC 42546]|uniref:tetratricopeptide repeat protein n=1 Tax=Spirosoma sp. KCTC 42546 TaxID=2520506 RepID=UPI00115B5314|nr:tetratricopeptide repeat protein [Spirosoma sp. KCTC 42546]QDK82093.1 tetratricopeptide repeat protein [Spirosoma sp. KCTC 42546]
MKNLSFLFCLFTSIVSYAQHDHHVDDTKTNHNHLAHMQASRAQNVYIHNLPPPKLMTGVGQSKLTIETKSEKAQQYFNQGLSLLHDFWDLEAYRAFKEAIHQDSTAIMPYWGLLQTAGADEDSIYAANKKIAAKKLKTLVKKATEHEKLYAEMAILGDSLKEKAYPEIIKKYELIVHKFPDDIDAKLFLALAKMSGFDTELKPNEGQLYSEFLLRDVQRTEPQNHAFHHYWIHLMEHCCPEQALKSADVLTSLAPTSGHIVHMPGHIYNRVGDYKKAHDTFVAAVKTDSAYMKREGIQEVDNWNYIHNINYLIANCAHDGRHKEGLYYAEKLKNMPISKSRKKIYDGTFFSQGILAPAKMEMAFGYWDRAAAQLEMVQDKDTMYSIANMDYKNGLLFFVKGMDALAKNKLPDAIAYSNSLDAFLWRNEHQSGKDSTLNKFYQNALNTASLELQGCIKRDQGKYNQAIPFLEKAQKQELELGYGEPPLYSRPVAISLARTYEKAGNWDKAADTYQSLLKRFPKSGYVYYGLVNLYTQKGDAEKTRDFETKLKDVSQYGDKGLYALTKQK